MMLSEDLARRASKVVLFEDAARDVDGRQVKMYSIVTPVNVVVQHFEEGQPPIEARPGDRLVVLGAADGDTNHLWLEIDEKNHPHADANLVLRTDQIRYLCEVGDGLHMKALH